MPLKPAARRSTPKDAKLVGLELRAERGAVCERCGIQDDGLFVRRVPEGAEAVADAEGRYRLDAGGAVALACRGAQVSRVILAVAHLDHNRDNWAKDNLALLCQHCHLLHDVGKHRHTRAGRKDQSRPLLAFGRDLFADDLVAGKER